MIEALTIRQLIKHYSKKVFVPGSLAAAAARSSYKLEGGMATPTGGGGAPTQGG